VKAMSAPSAASRFTIAAPMPRLPPVTNAFLPARLLIGISIMYQSIHISPDLAVVRQAIYVSVDKKGTWHGRERQTAQVRPRRSAGARHGAFLAKRLCRRVAFGADLNDGHQPAEPLCGLRLQGSAVSRGRVALWPHGVAGDLACGGAGADRAR